MIIFKLLKCKQWLQQRKQMAHITLLDISIFLRQFAVLIAAGIPIIKSCDILEKSQEKMAVRLLIYSIKREILAGKNLFYSLQQHSLYFDELTCELVQIGESTGKLDTLLMTIAHYQEKNIDFKNRLKQALFYPSIIIITSILITFCMFIFVIPRFAQLFADMQGSLPWITRAIFYLSAGLLQHIQWLFIFLILFIFFIVKGSRSVHFKHALKKLMLQFPLIKPSLYKITLARFARNLSLTLAAGLPMTDALKLTVNTCKQPDFASHLRQLRYKVSSGQQLHIAMGAHFFPPLMIQMIKIGEESGTLELMLDKMADFFDADVDQLFAKVSQLFEPLIMLVLGVLIGGLVIGLYLPIFKLGSAL